MRVLQFGMMNFRVFKSVSDHSTLRNRKVKEATNLHM